MSGFQMVEHQLVDVKYGGLTFYIDDPQRSYIHVQLKYDFEIVNMILKYLIQYILRMNRAACTCFFFNLYPVVIQGNSVYLPYIGQLVDLLTILDCVFHGLVNTTSISIGVEGGRQQGALKRRVPLNSKVLCSYYHKMMPYQQLILLASQVVIYSRLTVVCQVPPESFNDHSNTHGHQTGSRSRSE